MVGDVMEKNDPPLWEAKSIQKLIRYCPSVTYFGRFKAGGKLIRETLETTKNGSVKKTRR